LHIHASRGLFGTNTLQQELTVAKLMLLFNREWDAFIVKFARRNYSDLERWSKKPDIENTDLISTSNALQKVQKSKDTNDRYQAINLCNRHTIEFRIFRSTLRPERVLSALQLVDVLIAYCKDNSLTKILTSDIASICSTCNNKELTEYLVSKNLNKDVQ